MISISRFDECVKDSAKRRYPSIEKLQNSKMPQKSEVRTKPLLDSPSSRTLVTQLNTKRSLEDVSVEEISGEKMETFQKQANSNFQNVFEFVFPIFKKKKVKAKIYVEEDISDETLLEILKSKKKSDPVKRTFSLARLFRDAFKIGRHKYIASIFKNLIFVGKDIRDGVQYNTEFIRGLGTTLNRIKNCNLVISRYNNDPDWIRRYVDPKKSLNSQVTNSEIDLEMLDQRKAALREEFFSKNPPNIDSGTDKAIILRLRELEEIYEYTLAIKFKQKHFEEIKRNCFQIGVENVRIASDVISLTGAFGISLALDFSSEFAENAKDIYYDVVQKAHDKVYDDPDKHKFLSFFFNGKDSVENKKKRIIRYATLLANMSQNLELYKDDEKFPLIKKTYKEMVEATGCDYAKLMKNTNVADRRIMLAYAIKDLLRYR